MRVKVNLAYDGSSFYGMQIQNDKKTVTGEIEKALKKVGIKESNIIISSRTDRYVHALSQIISIDLPPFWSDEKKLKKYLNDKLDKSIYIKDIKRVDDKFHPRYDAKSRVYRYIISKEKLLPHFANYISYMPDFNFKKVKSDISLFEGIYDFAMFKKSGSSTKTSVRDMKRAFAYRYKNCYILHFESNGFLRSQVRMMIQGVVKYSKKELQEQLECKKKHFSSIAPANGLYLCRVKY